MSFRKRTSLIVSAAGIALVACTDVPYRRSDDIAPAGVIQGSIVYVGPPPCTQSVQNPHSGSFETHVVGSAILLVFNENLLPPPDGLGTSARSLAVVSGDQLFDGLEANLPNPADGQIACPPPGAPPVEVSARWAVGPLEAGKYQVRGFYDYDGDFSPILKIHQLPTKGDVGGGAIVNAAAAAMGAKPEYQTLTVGVDDGTGNLVVPSTGAVVDGVAVTLGKVLPFSRPVAYVQAVVDQRPTASSMEADPANVVLPSDQVFSVSPTNPTHVAMADKEFLRLTLASGVPPGEVANAEAPPILIDGTPDGFHVYPNTDSAGNVVTIPEITPGSGLPKIPDLFPQVLFAKLDASDATGLTPQASPAVLIDGLVTTTSIVAAAGITGEKVVPTLTVNLRPSTICARPLDPASDVLVVTPSFQATNGEVVIGPDQITGLKSALAARLGKMPSQVEIVEGCLPPGTYGINLVYDTGQAWTLPNEAGVCQSPLETAVGNPPTACAQNGATRPVLASQNATIRIGGELTSGFCASTDFHTLTMNDGGDVADSRGKAIEYVSGIPKACLSDAEIADPTGLARQIAR